MGYSRGSSRTRLCTRFQLKMNFFCEDPPVILTLANSVRSHSPLSIDGVGLGSRDDGRIGRREATAAPRGGLLAGLLLVRVRLLLLWGALLGLLGLLRLQWLLELRLLSSTSADGGPQVAHVPLEAIEESLRALGLVGLSVDAVVEVGAASLGIFAIRQAGALPGLCKFFVIHCFPPIPTGSFRRGSLDLGWGLSWLAAISLERLGLEDRSLGGRGQCRGDPRHILSSTARSRSGVVAVACVGVEVESNWTLAGVGYSIPAVEVVFGALGSCVGAIGDARAVEQYSGSPGSIVPQKKETKYSRGLISGRKGGWRRRWRKRSLGVGDDGLALLLVSIGVGGHLGRRLGWKRRLSGGGGRAEVS